MGGIVLAIGGTVFLLALALLVKDQVVGLDCGLRREASVVFEPDLEEIDATSPIGAIEDVMRGNGPNVLGMEPGPIPVLLARIVATGRDHGAIRFAYIDDAVRNSSDISVEPVGDGRYFVSGARFCA